MSVSSPAVIAGRFAAEAGERVLEPSFNVAPGTDVYSVISDGHRRRIETMRWGLIPHWAKDASIGNRMINARSETLATKNAFKGALRRRRCLIPVDGFYEWQVVEARRAKQPWYFHADDEMCLAFAGLWESWRDPVSSGSPTEIEEPELLSCTIITRTANAMVAPVHDRMPVIMGEDLWDQWLDPEIDDPEDIEELLEPNDAVALMAHMVGTQVNRPGNDGPALVEPIQPDEPEPTLFDSGFRIADS